MLRGSPNWYPGTYRRLASAPRAERPLTLMWMFQPLPPPRSSGFRWPVPKLREIAKMLLRDPRRTDPYSNYWRLRWLHRNGLIDILATTTLSRVDFLAERGIAAQYVPWGYSVPSGYDMKLERDIEALFLGERRILRRRRLIAWLRRSGINVTALGDWTPNSGARTETASSTGPRSS